MTARNTPAHLPHIAAVYRAEAARMTARARFRETNEKEMK